MSRYTNQFDALLSDSDSDCDSVVMEPHTRTLPTKEITLTYPKKSVFNKTNYVPKSKTKVMPASKLVTRDGLKNNFPTLTNDRVNKIISDTHKKLSFAQAIAQPIKKEVKEVVQKQTTHRITKIKPLISVGGEPDFSRRIKVRTAEDKRYELQRDNELVEEMEGTLSDDEFEEWFDYHKEQNPDIYGRNAQSHGYNDSYYSDEGDGYYSDGDGYYSDGNDSYYNRY